MIEAIGPCRSVPSIIIIISSRELVIVKQRNAVRLSNAHVTPESSVLYSFFYRSNVFSAPKSSKIYPFFDESAILCFSNFDYFFAECFSKMKTEFWNNQLTSPLLTGRRSPVSYPTQDTESKSK